MAIRKTERLMNLVICLLSTRRFLSRDQIRQAVEGYRDLSDEAFERSFERDKDALRAAGIPIEVGSYEAYFDDEVGYRIVRTDFELPEVSFTQDEVSVLGVALRVWDQASVAEQTARAFAKLRAAGVEPDPSRLAALSPAVTAVESSFDVLWKATLSSTPVQFRYRSSSEDRLVQPWRLTWTKGCWYLLAFDIGRNAARVFKLSRITSDPQLVGKAGSYSVPAAKLADLAANLVPKRANASAIVALRAGRAPQLRRNARRCESDSFEGYENWEVDYVEGGGFVSTVAALGADAIVLEPNSLREQVRQHLLGVVKALDGGQA